MSKITIAQAREGKIIRIDGVTQVVRATSYDPRKNLVKVTTLALPTKTTVVRSYPPEMLVDCPSF